MRKTITYVLPLMILGSFVLPAVSQAADKCTLKNSTDRSSSSFNPAYAPGECMVMCPDKPNYTPSECRFVQPGTGGETFSSPTSGPGGGTPGSGPGGGTPGTGPGGGTPGTGSGGTQEISIPLKNPFALGDNLYDLVKAIINKIILPIGGVIVVLAFIYSGFKYVMARGNSSALEEANRNLKYVAIGTAVLLGAWVIAEVIENTIKQIMQ